VTPRGPGKSAFGCDARLGRWADDSGRRGERCSAYVALWTFEAWETSVPESFGAVLESFERASATVAAAVIA